MAQDPGAASWLRLNEGLLAGQALSTTNRTINVAPGAPITGWFTVNVNSTWPSETTVWMGVTPTWGDARYNFLDVGGWVGPYMGNSPAIAVNMVAPDTPGTYYIITAYHPEFNAAQVLSCTNWSAGETLWNNGDDVASWPPTTIATANANGTVLVDYWYPTGNSPRYVPATAIIIIVGTPTPTDPGGSSSLLLVSGTLAGQSVSAANHVISVNPGVAITGQFTVQINSTFGAGTTMSMGVTPTWGNQSSSYTDLGGFTTPVTGLTRAIDVSLTAPTTPGTYYIIAGFRDESSAAYVMSCTTTATGSPFWNNGDDIANWSPAAITTANTAGTTYVDYYNLGSSVPRYVPATAIVVVVGASSDDPGATSSLLLVSGTVNGQYVTASNRTLTVMPGDLLSGQLQVQINSTFASGTPMALGLTSSWGIRQTGYADLGDFPTPTTGLSKTIPVYMEAPSEPGTYYIITAFYGDYTAGQVMSATHSSVGSLVWYNGDDIAGWTPTTINTANTDGTVLVNYLYPWGNNPRSVPATAIKVIVSTYDPAPRSRVGIMSGSLAGQALSDTNTTIIVAPGAAISGQFTVKINSAWPAGSYLSMGITPSWGSHADSYAQLESGFDTPIGNWMRDIQINYTAPDKPGIYYIITAFRNQASAAQVMSCTNVVPGSEVWGNGDDIADWTPASVFKANYLGAAYVNYLGLAGNSPRYVPAGIITVIVQTTEWHGDFNGDGRADVLWFNTSTGNVYVWLMEGFTVKSHGAPGAVSDLDWEIQGVADFNADGKSDILWRNQVTGQIYVWLMNGYDPISFASPGTVSNRNWRIERLGDFNGDHRADLLWRHALTGDLYVWLMNGAGITSMGSPGSVAEQNWHIRDTGDFNGDGKADILWYHALTGQVYVWLMNGIDPATMGCPGSASDLNWQIDTLADFNGDGKTDIFWQHRATGQAYVWLMNGSGLAANGSPGAMTDTAWEVMGAADFNGDGKGDIVWRQGASGQLFVWLMNGVSTTAEGSPGTVDNLNWQMMGLADFDGDKKADIIWRHRSTGEVALWLMNGTFNTGQGTAFTVDDWSWRIVK